MTSSTPQNFEERVGTVVLESAVLKFLATAEPEVKEAFTVFIEQNQGSPTLFTDLESTYPAFADILTKEIEAMQSDMTSITGDEKRNAN